MLKQDLENIIESFSPEHEICFVVDTLEPYPTMSVRNVHITTTIMNTELLKNVALLNTDDLASFYIPYENIKYVSVAGKPDSK